MSTSRRRYILVNTQSGVIDGLYLDRVFAEKSAVRLREAWPGLSWELEVTNEPFPKPGKVCLGHARAPKILKQYLVTKKA